MACRGRSAEPMHFFKVILPATLQDKKLVIPEKFVRKFGDELSAVVRLTVPNGHTWHVKLTKAEKEIWFHDGWHDFVHYHSICAGDFLVFKYEKHSNFHVLIFDKTACEIQYPYYCGGLENNEQNSLRMENDDSVEVVGFKTPNSPCKYVKNKASDNCRRSSRKSYTPLSQLNKPFFGSVPGTNRCRKCGASCATSKFKRPINPDSSTQDEHEEETEMNSNLLESASSRKRAIMADLRKRALNAAKVFEPVNPFCRVVMQPSYLHRPWFMYVPSYFAKKHLKGISGLIKLQISGGKQWPVRCIYRGGSAKLSQGWYEFAYENNLGEGDVCVFEVIGLINIVLKVTVFRVPERAEFASQLSSGSALGSNKFHKHVASLENPKFRLGIDIGSKRCKIEELDEIHKSYSVGDDNELIKAKHKVKAHSADKNNAREKFHELEDKGISIIRNCRHLAAEETERVIAAARLLKPKHPSFLVILLPDNLKSHRVYVPAKFGNRYFSNELKCIKVQDSDGREWSLPICPRSGFYINKMAAFSEEKNLRAGDICIFELLRVKEPLLKVSVFYASAK